MVQLDVLGGRGRSHVRECEWSNSEIESSRARESRGPRARDNRNRRGNELRDLRKARKLTQALVAKALGITQDSVSCLEKRSHLLSRH